MLSAIRPGIRVLLRRSSSCIQRLSVHNEAPQENSADFHEGSGELARRFKQRNLILSSKPIIESRDTLPLHASDPDSFGDIASATDVPPEFAEGDEVDKEEGTEYSRSLEEEERVRIDYAALITELLAEKKFNMALEVLEKEMKKNKTKPDRYIYVQLITFCGKVGYPQKAYKLFATMRKRQMPVTHAVYTSLFNACANCPDKKKGLQYAERVREVMRVKDWRPTQLTYNAMIKAYGRCEDLQTAFSIVDEMMLKRFPLDVETMSFLLQSCISNKEKGFQYGLLIWHKMRQYCITPNNFSYNLMLRCIRDTGLGGEESAVEFFKTFLPHEQVVFVPAPEKTDEIVHSGEKEEYPWDEANTDIVSGNGGSGLSSQHSPKSSDALSVAVRPTRPDLLSNKPTLGGLEVVGKIESPADRLLLVGGLQGFLASMIKDKNEPDIKTFTLLLECIPPTLTAEENLLRELDAHGVTPDIGFFNALIFRRSQREAFDLGMAVLDLIKQHGLEMDVITAQSLAYCCYNKNLFSTYLNDMQEAGFSPTPLMLGVVLRRALKDKNFGFIHYVMDAYILNDVQVNNTTIEQTEAFYQRNIKILQRKILPHRAEVRFYESDYFKTGIKIFCCKFADWKRRITIEESTVQSPWQQFKKTGDESKELEPYIERWRKGKRYAKAQWSKNNPPYIPPQSKK